MIFLILSTFFTFLICYVLISLLLPFFNKFLLSTPIPRSSHKKPIPSGAGIIFSVTSSVFSSLNGWYIPLLCIPISLIGFIDDKLYISKSIRYFSQISTAFMLIFFSNSRFIDLYAFNSINLFLNLLFIVAVVIAITAIINFFNFMDGIDGLVASVFIFYLLFLCLTDSTNKIFLLVSLISFLIFNWMPAKIFMGDAGSTFIGAVYAGTLLEANNLPELYLRILILLPILGDAFITLIMRLLNKQNIFKGHNLHLYQRLNQAGLAHTKISILYLSASIFLCLIGMYSLIIGTCFALIVIFFGYYLDKKKAIPFNKYY